jgi:hypothetical protein
LDQCQRATPAAAGEAVIRDGAFTTVELRDLVSEHNRRSALICAHLGKPPQ